MKLFLRTLALLLCLARGAAAQEEGETVKEVINLSSSAAPLSSLDELPSVVKSRVSAIINARMGNVADSLRFFTGEVLYTNSIRAAMPGHDSVHAVPLYDLRFQLTDAGPGRQEYALELRVDERGRLLFINWPASGYSDRAKLASWPVVLAYATHFAKLSKFYTPHYQVALRYNAARGKMVWVFQFPVKDLSRVLTLRTVEVDWLGPKRVKEYMGRY